MVGPDSSRRLFLTTVANDCDSLAFLQSVFEKLCFTLVLDTIITTKYTKDLFDETTSSVSYDVFVSDDLYWTAVHRTLDFDLIQDALIARGGLVSFKLLAAA